jgi:hypothetical protein
MAHSARRTERHVVPQTAPAANCGAAGVWERRHRTGLQQPTRGPPRRPTPCPWGQHPAPPGRSCAAPTQRCQQHGCRSPGCGDTRSLGRSTTNPSTGRPASISSTSPTRSGTRMKVRDEDLTFKLVQLCSAELVRDQGRRTAPATRDPSLDLAGRYQRALNRASYRERRA